MQLQLWSFSLSCILYLLWFSQMSLGICIHILIPPVSLRYSLPPLLLPTLQITSVSVFSSVVPKLLLGQFFSRTLRRTITILSCQSSLLYFGFLFIHYVYIFLWMLGYVSKTVICSLQNSWHPWLDFYIFDCESLSGLLAYVILLIVFCTLWGYIAEKLYAILY